MIPHIYSITLSIVETVYPPQSTSNMSLLAGITMLKLNEGAVNFLNELTIVAYPTSLLTINATLMVTQRSLGNLVTLFPNRIVNF